jgi:hypothetical protein
MKTFKFYLCIAILIVPMALSAITNTDSTYLKVMEKNSIKIRFCQISKRVTNNPESIRTDIFEI